MFWIALFLFIGTTIASALLQKPPKDATAASKGDFQVPTAEEGRPIPVVFGTCEMKGPNVVWWGDLKIDPIKKSSGGFLGIGAKKVTVSYKYAVGMLLALCHGPIDALIDITIGDKSVSAQPDQVLHYINGTFTFHPADPTLPQSYNAAGTSFFLEMNNLFGGDEREGGVRGDLKFYYGSPTQGPDSYLTSKFGSTAPSYHGLCYAVLPQTYVGTSQYIKNWGFIVRRCPTPSGFDAAKSNINGDANPAHMIFEVMNSTDYGLGIPSARFDLATFTNAASTLYTEGLGMSILLDSDGTADAFVADVLRTIDATLYTDPATGLWTLKLVRADYDPGTLLEFTTDDLVDAPEWSRGSWSETINEIKLEYVDRAANFQTRVAQAQETANYAVQGMMASETLRFHGLSNMTIAQKIAMRELKASSYPLAQFRIKVNRKAWSLRPGSPFKLTWAPPSGASFSGMVLRATTIRYGALENGVIEIDAIEDAFSVSGTAYPDPGGSLWSEPMTDPTSASAQALTEVPYQFVGQERWVMALTARGDSMSYSADVWLDEGGGYFPGNTSIDLTPSGLLAANYSAKTAAVDTVGFTIAAGGASISNLVAESTDALGRSRGDNLALFADTGEIVSWTTCTDNGDGTFTFSDVLRGALDTVPDDHSTSTRVWFFTEGAGTTKTDAYLADLSTSAKLLPKNPRGTASFAAATVTSLTTSSRAWKPYPPANVKINSLGYGAWPTTTVGDAILSWSHRNRITQGVGNPLLAQDTDGGYTPEGDLTVEVLVGGVLKRTYSHLTSTSLVNALIGGPGFSYGICGRSNGDFFVSSSYVVVGSSYGSDPHCIFKVTSSGLTLFHGSTTQVGFVNGTTTNSRWHWPQQMAVDSSGNIYVTDQEYVIRRILASTGSVETFADLTPYGYIGNVTIDGSDNVYVFAMSQRLVIKITQARAVSVLAGNAYLDRETETDGTGTSASFVSSCMLAADSSGNLFALAPHGVSAGGIRYITPAGVVTTINAGFPDFPGNQMAVVGSDVYFGNVTHPGTVHKCTPAGTITTFATHPEGIPIYNLQKDLSSGGHLLYLGYIGVGVTYGTLSAAGVFTELYRLTPLNGYTGAMRVADDSDGTKAVTMRIKPINEIYNGTIRTTPPVVMTGYGMTFGQYFGGIQG